MPCEGTGPGPGPVLNINFKSFDPNDPRLLSLGNTEEWPLSSEAAEHPFHIHINSFMVCSGIVDGEPLPFPEAHYLMRRSIRNRALGRASAACPTRPKVEIALSVNRSLAPLRRRAAAM